MKKISKIISMVLVGILISSMAVSAGVVYVNPVSVYSQSFANLSACPEGWATTGSVALFAPANDYVTQSAGGSWKLYSTKQLDFESYDYEIEFVSSRAYSNGVDYHFTQDDISKFTSTQIAAPNGYTIKMHIKKDGKVNPYFELYKNGTEIGDEYVTGWTYFKSTNFTFKLKVTSDTTTLDVIDTDTETTLGTITYKDTDPIYVGKLGMVFNSVGADMKVYSVNARKIGVNNFKIHHNFSKYDTKEGLENLGWIPDNDAIITEENGLELSYVGTTTSGYGASRANLIYDKYNLNGTYTVESSYYISQNKGAIIVNYQDDKNYYGVEYGKDGTNNMGRIFRFKDNKHEILSTGFEEAIVNYQQIFARSLTPNKVTVTNTDSAVKFDVVLTDRNGGEHTFTYTDDSENRISSGKIGIQFNAAGMNYVNYVKAYQGTVEPAITGEYYVDGEKSTVLEKGNTSFNMPTKLLGCENVVVSALYADNIMQDIKVYDLQDFLTGKKELFDTSGYASGNVKVKTYIWKSLSKIIPLTQEFSLTAN